MNENWRDVVAAWELAAAGRGDEAIRRASGHPGLAALLATRFNRPGEDAYPVLAGWKAYYKGDYRVAFQEFLKQTQESCQNDWLTTWAELGAVKVASDCGRWRAALGWCASAWRSAADGEHVDLLAQVAGARGEVLLRAGRPREASAAFDEDLSLLTLGSLYRGRVRCYQAHAWSRLGRNGTQAAQLAYRLSIHSPGESSTASFARAGLAILAARIGDPAVLAEATAHQLDGICRFWASVACAKLASDEEMRRSHLQDASAAIPEYYYAERWWFAGWCDSLGVRLKPSPGLDATIGVEVPPLPSIPRTRVEDPVAASEIEDAPWWFDLKLPRDADAWWTLRDAFMP